MYLSVLFSYRTRDLKSPHFLQYYSIFIAVFLVLDLQRRNRGCIGLLKNFKWYVYSLKDPLK